MSRDNGHAIRTAILANLAAIGGYLAARGIGVGIRGACRVVPHGHALDCHRERAFAVVDRSTSPSNGTGRLRWVTSRPSSNFELGWRRGKVAIGRLDGTHDVAVNEPSECVGSPVNRIGVKGSLGCVDSNGLFATFLSLAEIIALQLAPAADPLQIDLILGQASQFRYWEWLISKAYRACPT